MDDQITLAAKAFGALGGSARSKAKRLAAIRNGKLGGRPKKAVRKNKTK